MGAVSRPQGGRAYPQRGLAPVTWVGDGPTGRRACAVDDVLRTGNCRSEVGAHEQDSVGDLVGCHVVADRDGRLISPGRPYSPGRPG